MPRSRRRVACGRRLVVVALAVGLTTLACRRTEPHGALDVAPHVAHTPGLAESEIAIDLSPDLEASGRLRIEPLRAGSVADEVVSPCETIPSPDGTADVSTSVNARIVRWHVLPGAVVRSNADVVTLESSDVAEQRSRLVRARIDIADLTARLAEESRLLPQGATSGRNVRETRAALLRARAAEDEARRALQVAHASERGAGGTFTLRAPIDGTVVRRELAQGAVAQPMSVLVSIVNMRTMRVAAHLPESVTDVPMQTPATVRLRGHDRGLAAHVVWLAPSHDRTTRTHLVHLAFDSPPSNLALEESGTVQIHVRTGESGGVIAPIGAIYREGSSAMIFVRIAAGHFVARPVSIGADDGVTVALTSGANAGEQVIVHGVFLAASEYARARARRSP